MKNMSDCDTGTHLKINVNHMSDFDTQITILDTGIGLVRKNVTTETLSQTTDALPHALWSAASTAALPSPAYAPPAAATGIRRLTRPVTMGIQ